MNSLLRTLDVNLANHIKNWSNRIHPIMSFVTLFGQPVVIFLAVTSSIIAFRRGQTRIAWAFAATLAAFGANELIKLFLHRTRPDTLYVSLMKIKSYSFPSSHAFGSMVVYGLLAYLSIRYLSYPLNYLGAAGSGILIFLVGISRVYLGAHYPTDVLAGWLLGAASLGLIIKFIFP